MVAFSSVSFAFAAVTFTALLDTASASCAHGTSLLRRETYSKLSARGEIQKRVTVSKFGYLGIDGPTQWANLSPNNSACATGTTQSPIDITTSSATTVAGSTLDLKLVDVDTAEFENLGSTVEVVMEGKGSSLTLDGTEFELKQFHFHSPSEHTLDGEYYPLEMHMVHQSNNSEIAVVAVLFQLSEAGTTTDLLTTVVSKIDEIATPGTVTEIEALSFAGILKTLTAATFISYIGSLTTPPCSEGPEFFLASEPLDLNVATFNSIKSVVGFNSRFTQNTLGSPNLLTTATLVADSDRKKTTKGPVNKKGGYGGKKGGA